MRVCFTIPLDHLTWTRVYFYYSRTYGSTMVCDRDSLCVYVSPGGYPCTSWGGPLPWRECVGASVPSVRPCEPPVGPGKALLRIRPPKAQQQALKRVLRLWRRQKRALAALANEALEMVAMEHEPQNKPKQGQHRARIPRRHQNWRKRRSLRKSTATRRQLSSWKTQSYCLRVNRWTVRTSCSTSTVATGTIPFR